MSDNIHDHFEKCAQMVEKYTGKPWDGRREPLDDALALQIALTDALEDHADWLQGIKDRAEQRGLAWTTRTCRLQSRLDGDLTTCPEWLADEFEQATPEHRMNYRPRPSRNW